MRHGRSLSKLTDTFTKPAKKKGYIMSKGDKTVDGFKFMPPKLSAWIKSFISDEDFKGKIPFQLLTKPASEAKFALVTSAGIRLKSDPAFDMEREKKEPTWGDPTYRKIPKGTSAADIDVNHLHINSSYIKQDLNVMLPLDRMEEFANEGIIGSLAETSYSFYGFQWERTEFLEKSIQPMIDHMNSESVDAVLLTPA